MKFIPNLHSTDVNSTQTTTKVIHLTTSKLKKLNTFLIDGKYPFHTSVKKPRLQNKQNVLEPIISYEQLKCKNYMFEKISSLETSKVYIYNIQ